MSVRRLAALAAVFTGGVCASIPYLKPQRNSDLQTQPGPAPEGALGSPAVNGPQIAIDNSPRPVKAISAATPAVVPNWAQPTPIALPVDELPLPHLPNAPLVRQSRASRILEPDFSSPEPALAAKPRRQPPVPPRRHRITDGDSLSTIALRYLGDERRGSEIAQLNRHVIRDPNLLPVGAEILIPVGERSSLP